MRELLKARGLKATPQRELILRSFFEAGAHVSVDELYAQVRRKDRTVGYATVWRNLKLACQIGIAQEVNLGDGVTRYDRVTFEPHGHLYCLGCKRLIEFTSNDVTEHLKEQAEAVGFRTEGFRVEIQGYCRECRERRAEKESEHA